MRSKRTSRPSRNGRTASTASSAPSRARSPPAVPAKTRRPGANTASGASVNGSTTTSPRMPCAFRIRPTIANSGDSMLLLFFYRDRGRGALRRASRFVARLQDAGAAKQRANGVGRLRADIEPVVRALGLHGERVLRLPGRILADDLDELAVARALRVGDDDAVHRGFLPPNAAETNLDGHGWCSRQGSWYCAGLIA